MKALLIPLGSHGDVHPFVGLGVALKRRGHDVVVATNEAFRALVERNRLDFVPIGGEQEFRAILDDPGLWQARRGFELVVKYAMLGALRRVYEVVAEHYVPGETAVATQITAIGARVAQDKLGVPLATIHLQPIALRSHYDTPRIPLLRFPRITPRFVKRAIFNAIDDAALDPMIRPELNKFRSELGLPPARRICRDWWNSPSRIIGMFPDWFAPIQPDWPPQLRLTGFPLFDEGESMELPRDLRAFLDEGDPPVAFTPGSAMRHGTDFFEASVEALRLVGRRGILLSRFAEHIPPNLPRTIRHETWAPFSKLLPRVSLLVHHGGVGTSAQALAAGIPQIITPFAHDQPDNSRRLERLGVAREIPPNRYRPRVLAEKIEELLQSKTAQVAARELASRIDPEQAFEVACLLLEGLLENRT